jgi:hypothetical protein
MLDKIRIQKRGIFLKSGIVCINPFQSNFSANRTLPSSYLFWAVKRLVDYLELSYSFKREKHGETERIQPALSVGYSLYYKKKTVGQAQTVSEQTQQKPCQTSSDIGAEPEKSYCRTRSDVGSERVKQ